MQKTAVRKEAFEGLVSHLVGIEEQKERVLQDYFSALTRERAKYEEFITNYIKKIEAIVSQCQAGKSIDSIFPFIIIGSIVELEDLETRTIEKYQIVSPFENRVRPDLDTASYLSPMGKALLLKKPQEKVTVKTPGGQFSYLVKSVEMFG